MFDIPRANHGQRRNFLAVEDGEPFEYVEGGGFVYIFAAGLQGNVVAYVGAGDGALVFFSAVECMVDLVFFGHFGEVCGWMDEGREKSSGGELIIVLACC